MIRILLTRIASVCLITCALFAWSEAQAQQDTLYMNLEECIKYGLRNNVNVKNADIDTHSADASVGEVRAQGLPQINSQITMTNNLAIQVTPIPDFLSPVVYQVLQAENLATIPEGVGEGVFPAAFGTNYAANASVTLEQMIFNGSYFIGLKAARTYREMAALQKKGVEIDMVEAITSAYYSFLVGEEGLKLAADNFKRIDTLRRETRIMYENGVAERIDMNRVEVEYNNSKTELQNLYRSYAVNMLGLKYQMGMPVNTPLKITENISSIEVDLLKMSEEEYSYHQRVEYSQIQTQMDLETLNMRNNRSQYAPSLYFNANYGYIMGANQSERIFTFTGENKSWFQYANIGVRLDIPIFDGLSKSYKIQQNKLDIHKLENQKKDLENSIDLQVEQSRANLSNSLENLELQQGNMELAREVFDVTKIKYQEGVGSNLEVVNADNAYKAAQTNYYNSLYEALLAKVAYEKAIGNLYK